MARRVYGDTSKGAKAFAPPLMGIKVAVGEVRQQGDEAHVEVTTEFEVRPGNEEYRPYSETVHLRRIKGDWKIVPVKRSEMSRERMLGTIALLLTDDSIVAPGRNRIQTPRCAAAMKVLVYALESYANDHGGRLPKDPYKLRAALTPYVMGPEVFQCLAAAKGEVGFILNPKLAGKRFAVVSQDVPLIFEGAKPVLRHYGRALVAFPSGYVDYVGEAQLRRLRN
jgi:hypothetical protein